MKYQDVVKKKIPQSPGVYFFVNKKKKILYIGKASSLRDRIRSYFRTDVLNLRGQHIVSMVHYSQYIHTKTTDSVLEALILEAKLIKIHQPPFNTKEKDDKSFNYIVITDEKYPRVLVVRGKDLQDGVVGKRAKVNSTFGPFTRGSVLKDAMRIIRKIFPYRDTCNPEAGKSCFNYQLGLCPGICADGMSLGEYRNQIKNLKLFLCGHKKKVITNLRKSMNQFASLQEFEKAQSIKHKIFTLTHIEDTALLTSSHNTNYEESGAIFRIEGYDIAHMSGLNQVGAMAVIENGQPSSGEYRKFKIKTFKRANDTRALREVFERRLGHSEWHYPKLFVADGGKAQKNAMEVILRSIGVKIPVVSVVKDSHHRPREILGISKIGYITRSRPSLEREILLANREAHRFALSFHRKKRAKLV